MPDYTKTVIYKIVCKDETITDMYIGHTTNFKNRIIDHKCCCNNIKDKSYNIKLYHFIRENGGWDNWDMIKIEEYPCNNINEATKRERYWVEELKSSLNTDIPSRTQKEYYKENINKIKEYSKKYNEKIITCECGCIFRNDSLSKHLKTQIHKDLLKQLITNNGLTNSIVSN